MMQVHEPGPFADTPTQRAADRRKFRRAINVTLATVLLLLAIYFGVQPHLNLAAWTVAPHSTQSLLGLLTAPLLHGSVEHVMANCIALCILLPLTLMVYPRATLRGLPLMWLGSGLGAWLLGTPGTHHLGASGVTHGLLFLVMTIGLIRRDRPSIAAALIAFLFYGGMLLTVLPQEAGVSWQSHLGGAIGGVLAGVLLRYSDPRPPRRRYAFEDESEPDDPQDAIRFPGSDPR
jgi:membrane associated rhomboid family serine protease